MICWDKIYSLALEKDNNIDEENLIYISKKESVIYRFEVVKHKKGGLKC